MCRENVNFFTEKGFYTIDCDLQTLRKIVFHQKVPFWDYELHETVLQKDLRVIVVKIEVTKNKPNTENDIYEKTCILN